MTNMLKTFYLQEVLKKNIIYFELIINIILTNLVIRQIQELNLYIIAEPHAGNTFSLHASIKYCNPLHKVTGTRTSYIYIYKPIIENTNSFQIYVSFLNNSKHYNKSSLTTKLYNLENI